jgi:Icc-related predicted phosphoesterase
MNTIITGDIHTQWGDLYDLIEVEKPERVLQVGDLGYWPSLPDVWPPKLAFSVPVYFCDGNHEDHWALRDRKSDVLYPNVTYMPRGSVMEIDGLRVMFFGGAVSIDKHVRKEGVSWFSEETASQANFAYAMSDDGPIDVVISHTAPVCIDWVPRDMPDPTSHALQAILEHFKPSRWYFGHFHRHESHMASGCEFTVLNLASEDGWWVKL